VAAELSGPGGSRTPRAGRWGRHRRRRTPPAAAQPLADQLRTAAVQAFQHSFGVGCRVAGAVAAAGAVLAWVLLPARPATIPQPEVIAHPPGVSPERVERGNQRDEG
jgi:hypothetical protein